MLALSNPLDGSRPILVPQKGVAGEEGRGRQVDQHHQRDQGRSVPAGPHQHQRDEEGGHRNQVAGLEGLHPQGFPRQEADQRKQETQTQQKRLAPLPAAHQAHAASCPQRPQRQTQQVQDPAGPGGSQVPKTRPGRRQGEACQIGRKIGDMRQTERPVARIDDVRLDGTQQAPGKPPQTGQCSQGRGQKHPAPVGKSRCQGQPQAQGHQDQEAAVMHDGHPARGCQISSPLRARQTLPTCLQSQDHGHGSRQIQKAILTNLRLSQPERIGGGRHQSRKEAVAQDPSTDQEHADHRQKTQQDRGKSQDQGVRRDLDQGLEEDIPGGRIQIRSEGPRHLLQRAGSGKEAEGLIVHDPSGKGGAQTNQRRQQHQDEENPERLVPWGFHGVPGSANQKGVPAEPSRRQLPPPTRPRQRNPSACGVERGVSAPPRILLSGYYGFGNLGDEAILESLAGEILHQSPEARLRVLTADPDRARELGLDPVPRKSPIPILRALMDSDLLISGGGGLVQDSTGPGSVAYYLGLVALARGLGRQAMLFCQGWGPLRTPTGRRLARLLAPLASLATFRDEQSCRDFQALAPRVPVRLTADPALLLQPPPPARMTTVLQEEGLAGSSEDGGPLVAVAIRPWPGAPLEALAQALGTFCQVTGARVLFLPFQPDRDTEPSRELAARLGPRARIAGPRSPRETLGLLARADLVVAMRLHALILAAGLGLPHLGLSYDPKVERFCTRAGGMHLPLQGLPAEEISGALRSLWQDRLTRQAGIKERADAMRDAARRAVSGALTLARTRDVQAALSVLDGNQGRPIGL